MKLIDWYNFNLGNNRLKCDIGDIYVKVFRNESYDKKDMIFEQLMDPKDMIHLFGDYEMFILGIDEKNCTIKVCIYKAD